MVHTSRFVCTNSGMLAPPRYVNDDDACLARFVEGSRQLVQERPTFMGDDLHVNTNQGKRFIYLRGNMTDQPSFPDGYTFARIERETGFIYSQAGKKPVGSIFSPHHGLECVTRDGVIVNETRKKERLAMF